MAFFNRNEDGRLRMESMNLQILIEEMFYEAKNEDEIDWILENIQSCAELASDIAMEYLE